MLGHPKRSSTVSEEVEKLVLVKDN